MSETNVARKFPAITIWQPWASLIAAGEKRYETRTWQPAARTLKPGCILMIHAGKANGREQRDTEEFLYSRFPDAIYKARNLWRDYLPRYPQGAIVAAVRFLGAHPAHTIQGLSEQERLFGGFSAGRYAWEVEVLKLPEKPIEVSGKQGIWWWEGAVK